MKGGYSERPDLRTVIGLIMPGGRSVILASIILTSGKVALRKPSKGLPVLRLTGFIGGVLILLESGGLAPPRTNEYLWPWTRRI